MSKPQTPVAKAAAPFRTARQKYVKQLASTRAEIEELHAVLSVPKPVGVPSQLDIERARLLDEAAGTANAADLEKLRADAIEAQASAALAADEAAQALPALQARAEALEGLIAESRKLELSAISDAAAAMLPGAAAKYRTAAEVLVDALAELRAVQAAHGAVFVQRANDVNKRAGESPYRLGSVAAVELPSIETLGPGIEGDYVPGVGVATVGDSELNRRASQALAELIGGAE